MLLFPALKYRPDLGMVKIIPTIPGLFPYYLLCIQTGSNCPLFPDLIRWHYADLTSFIDLRNTWYYLGVRRVR